jgi:Uma2 family endonuclease
MSILDHPVGRREQTDHSVDRLIDQSDDQSVDYVAHPVFPLIDPERMPRSLRMTEAEFVNWANDDAAAEWVDGEVVLKMSVEVRQDKLQAAIRSTLEALVSNASMGQVRGPNFTMRLPVVPSRREPDVMFVGNSGLSRLGPTLLEGGCDLAIEIVSPESRSRDYKDKFLEYQAAGVLEYWILDPDRRSIEAYLLNPQSRRYELIQADADGRVSSVVVPGFWLRASDLFTDPLPNALQLMKLVGLV